MTVWLSVVTARMTLFSFPSCALPGMGPVDPIAASTKSRDLTLAPICASRRDRCGYFGESAKEFRSRHRLDL